VRRAVQRGVSLVEAIVAMAVMAFGMMAIVGLQTTLRQNSDIAKQRSEAVRFAEEAIEQWRAYSTLGAYDAITIGEDTDPPVSGMNATYTLKRTVAPGQGWKSIAVQVSWVDRAGQIQSVTLNSIIAAADPALSGILTMAPGSGLPVMPPLGRNPGIPAGATPMGGGRSIFMPSPGSGALWVFDDLTGVIVGVCNTVLTGQDQATEADTQNCVAGTTGFGLPLSGYVRFATGSMQPTHVDAEFPPSTALNLNVVLTLTSTGHPSPDHVCYTNAPTSTPTTRRSVRYYCAILFNANAVPVWSGISTLTPLAFLSPSTDVPWQLADDAADARASRYRVCRYTPATSDAELIPNQWHPRTYTNVTPTEQLTNQNFLVIRAGTDPGDGTGTAFTCPTDVPADPAAGDFVNSNTLPHQPPPSTP
jgi:Tfp pilus assembly protein PilV